MSHLGSINWNTSEDTPGRYGTFAGEEKSRVDKHLAAWYNPTLERTVREIALEVEKMRLAGKLRPFVEGEPIGLIQTREYKPIILPTTRGDRRQQDLRELRAENDRRLTELENL